MVDFYLTKSVPDPVIQYGINNVNGIFSLANQFSAPSSQVRYEAVNTFNSVSGVARNEDRLWVTPGGTVVSWYGDVISPAPGSE